MESSGGQTAGRRSRPRLHAVRSAFRLALAGGLLLLGGGTMAQTDTGNWYPWTAKSTNEPGEIGMADWIEKPAGKYGRPEMVGDRLVYRGRELKLWGLNNTYGACAPEKELADKRSGWYAKYGVNAVRFHKYADGTGWSGIQSEDSFVEFDPEALDRMDYLVAQFKKHGIYVKLSPTFGVKMGPADRKYVPYMDEFSNEPKKRVRAPYGAIYLASELQDMQILQTTKILRHRNPYTGLTYAEDPVIVTVEMFNEDAVLWNLTSSVFVRSKTLRERTAKRFCEWLKGRYGDAAGLEKAWGKEAFNCFKDKGFDNESLDAGNIVPYGNPWFYSIEQLEGDRAFTRRRMLDTMLFLQGLQDDFYTRFKAAVREAGYDGPMVGSNWHAGSNISHYYNLHSDAQVGIVDRHNYFGGARRGRQGGKFNNASMLRIPGGGMLSVGMQQVSDRPFMLSEWIHVQPNDWGIEGPAIMGAYGMGLQDWDVSFMFQNRDTGGFSDALCQHAWDVTVPKIIGLFPAVARQVYRGDVKRSSVVAPRYVNYDALGEGNLGFRDTVSQQHDIKVLNSDKVPAEALAAVRCTIEFTDDYRETPAFDVSAYTKGEVIVSSTGQLAWHKGDGEHSGWITIDTPGTQAFVGFAEGESFELGDVTIAPKSYYGAIYVSAPGPEDTLASAGKLLVTALARCRNTGQKLNAEENSLEEKGKGPILMEPVKATITLKRAGAKRVVLLDHDGLATGRSLPVQGDKFSIDGARDRTPYYLVEF